MLYDLPLICQEKSVNETVADTKPSSRPPSLSFVKVSASDGQPDLSRDGRPVSGVEVGGVEEEEMVIRVTRPLGTGLGISIAGGVGATPFRGDDEVDINRFKY